MVVAIILMAMCLTKTALAQAHHHPPQHAELHHKFYHSWQRPDNRNVSCCNLQDCAPAEAKMIAGKWWAKREADGKWVLVPDDRVENERTSPDGRSHLCVQPPHIGDGVFCFVAGAGI